MKNFAESAPYISSSLTHEGNVPIQRYLFKKYFIINRLSQFKLKLTLTGQNTEIISCE